ncbi:MAG: carbon-nitrogen hydrolase family protein [Thermodesulfobacteriota bacterium]|nr:carbon-nitrogen hydrolase family protein [Thermodesulfobacteriota bacterium]
MSERSRKRVCVAQINFNSENILRHLAKIESIVKEHRTADLIVFPELILHGHPSIEKPEGFLHRRMKTVYKSISQDLYQVVKDNGARVIIGESRRRGERYYNVATYVDGDTVDRYTKTHVHWTENFMPGRKLKVFDSPWGKIGITICFDAAFSEVWRVLALKGADVIVNISAVPKTFSKDYMWRRFSGAAIFNQTHIIYANRPGPFFSGYSAIFDPKGNTICKGGRKETIIETEIDLKEVDRWREEEKLYPYRRPLLYREIVNRHRAESIVTESQIKECQLAAVRKGETKRVA